MKTLEKCIIVNKRVNQRVYTCMQEQISGNSQSSISHWRSVPWAKGCCCRGTASGETQRVLTTVQKGGVWCGIHTAQKNSHLLHQETSARWQPQCHQFGASTALAAEDLEADGMILNVHSFLTQCLHSANNGNKSPNVQSSEYKAAHYSERENQQYEKAVPYVTTEITLTYCPRGCIAV